MILKTIHIRRGFFFPFLFLLFTDLCAEHPDSVLNKINKYQSCFHAASKQFNIDKKALMVIVFTERSMNVDWKDKALDIPLAVSGYNSSIGFCQVKMKTAYWIETQLSDSTSEFYLGNQYRDILPVSKSPKEIIEKLENDFLNIKYAAAYIKIIQNYWKNHSFPVHNRMDILGTLYSTGLFQNSGEKREPNSNPKPNSFGKKVLGNLKYFNSDKYIR